MDLATQPVTEKNRDAYYWRLLATAASFALFGLGGLCLRLVIFPLLGCLPGDAQTHRLRARQTVSRCFWFFVRFMARTGVLTYDDSRRGKTRPPGADDHRQSPVADRRGVPDRPGAPRQLRGQAKPVGKPLHPRPAALAPNTSATTAAWTCSMPPPTR